MNGLLLRVDHYSNSFTQRAAVRCSLCGGEGSLVYREGVFVHRETPCPDPEELERALAELAEYRPGLRKVRRR